MPGTTPKMTALQIRKRLLVTESELNRIQLLEEFSALRNGTGALAEQVQSLTSAASRAAAVWAGFTALKRASPGAASSGFVSKVLNVARLGATLWFAFRPRR